MRITPVQIYNSRNLTQRNIQKNDTEAKNTIQNNTQNYYTMPVNYQYGAKITFGEFFDPNRSIPHIDFNEYKHMNKHKKERLRLIYSNLRNSTEININELVDKDYQYMPLRDEKQMDSFLEVAKMYSKYKDHQIICLGRSPKWFLNASLWMKDGIDNYKFVAFSDYWYKKDPVEGVCKMEIKAPTPKEEESYKRYLKSIKADPKSIVEKYNETGKTNIITDYISTGKGATSFLDIMSKYAEEQGVLEEFSKAIEIVGIGNMEYQENFYYDDEDIPEPRVIMPKRLQKYEKNIKQTYYDIKDYTMFMEMLINQNTNECRSTYYPHNAWTVYRPDRFKTGMIKDMKKVKEIRKQFDNPRHMSHFTPAMYDYRNLLSFRILDAMNERGILKENHNTKM